MRLNSEKIKKMSMDKLAELLAKDMKKVGDTYSFAFSSKEDAIKLMNNRLLKKYSEITNSTVDEEIDFQDEFKTTITDYIKSTFETEDERYLQIFNNYLKQNVGEIDSYKTAHQALKKVTDFFTTIDYVPSEITCSSLLEVNSTTTTMIKEVFKKFEKQLAKSPVEDVFPSEVVASFVTAYAYLNNIELKTNEDLVMEETDDNLENNEFFNKLKSYYNSLPPVLTKKEEQELLEKSKNGDKLARNQLVERNLRLVISIAKRYKDKKIEVVDLVQDGSIGLINAIERFDLTKQTKFSTYACWWIVREINRDITNNGRTVRVPLHMQEKAKRYNKDYKKMVSKLNRYPTDAEIQKELRISDKSMQQIKAVNSEIASLDEQIKEDGDDTLAEFLASNELSVEEQYELKALHADLEKVFTSGVLSEREVEILKLRNGYYGEIYTLRSVSEQLGVSHTRVGQIEEAALQKIFRSKYKKSLAQYLTNGEDITVRGEKVFGHDRKPKAQKISLEKQMSIKYVYNYFEGYNKEEIATAIKSTLSNDELALLSKFYGNDLVNLTYNNTSSTSLREKLRTEILPMIQKELADNSIAVLNYERRQNNVATDYTQILNQEINKKSVANETEYLSDRKIDKYLSATLVEDDAEDLANIVHNITAKKLANYHKQLLAGSKIERKEYQQEQKVLVKTMSKSN